MTDQPGRLMLLDTASLYFRAFFGVPEITGPDGTPVNAVRGLLDFISRLVGDYRPTDLVCCWDDDWRPQWRVDLLPSYKAHRVVAERTGQPDVEEVPDPLEVQVPIIREVLAAFGICVVGAPGYEADDVIGSLASQASQPVDIVTGDRDLFQLVDDDRDVRVLYIARGVGNHERVTNDWVRAKYGIDARQYADFATLRGDASDGLPGVAGVGEKTAATQAAVLSGPPPLGPGADAWERLLAFGRSRLESTLLHAELIREAGHSGARAGGAHAFAATHVRYLLTELGVTGDLPILATALLAPLELPILDQQVTIEGFPVERVYDGWVDLARRIIGRP